MGSALRARRIELFCLLGLAALPASPAAATSIAFAKVADSATPIPGGSGAFPAASFGTPSLDGSAVVFSGGLSANHGIYSDAGGGLHAVVRSGDPIPGGTGGFLVVDPQHFEGGVVPFRGSGSAGQLGIYSASAESGGPILIADRNTAIPDGTGNFPDLGGAPDYSAGEYVLRSTVGVFRGTPGSLSVVADLNTPIPGGSGNFTAFGVATISEGQIAFLSAGFAYRTSAGGLSVVADNTTPIPGGSGSFTGVGFPVIDGGNILLSGAGTLNQRGLYLSVAGQLSVVADLFTAAPDGVGNFVQFGASYAIDGDTVAFTAVDGSQTLALYTRIGDSLVRVIGVGDQLDGKTLTNLQIGLDAVSGSRIGFLASFSDGSAGIYSAVVPEPSPLLLLGAGIAALGARRRRPRN